jgi:hypothetical protein
VALCSACIAKLPHGILHSCGHSVMLLSLFMVIHSLIFRGKKESGKEGAYSCLVLGGARSMDERRRALQVHAGVRHVVDAISLGCHGISRGHTSRHNQSATPQCSSTGLCMTVGSEGTWAPQL